MKTNIKSFKVAVIITAIALALSACTNPFFPAKELKESKKNNHSYTIVIDMIDNEEGDLVAASPGSGNAGDSITLNYIVANTKLYNLLDFGGTAASIAPVTEAGSGTRTYTINPDDASIDGKIVIIATFGHTDLTPDPIAFTDTEARIVKTYGDAAFTNAITNDHSGEGIITYSSGDEAVATVDNDGEVTILKAGTAVITARKAEDEIYANASRSYTLAVNPKPVTITGVSATSKFYDGTTTATITGTAQIVGLVGGDVVTVIAGTAAFANADVGDNITVTFSGFTLGGADAGNYTLSAQPTNVTANIIDVEVKPPMIQIPIKTAVTFTMGSPTDEPGRSSYETQHQVTLTKGFYMGKYQVTQAQYEAVTGSNPSGFKSPVAPETSTANRPVEQVSWYDAIVFCNKLSVLEDLTPAYTMYRSDAPNATGAVNTWTDTPANWSDDPADWGATVPTSSNTRWDAVRIVEDSDGYRLPTEAQWEYACRAGTATAFNDGVTNDYSDTTAVNLLGWYSGNSGSRTHGVGEKAPNAFGLYDMHGNVYEWCWDWYDANYGSAAGAAATDPVGASSGSDRVFRGGNWISDGRFLRSAYRGHDYPDFRNIAVGFRLLRP